MLFIILAGVTLWFSLFIDKFGFVRGLRKPDEYSYKMSLYNMKREARWKVVFLEECDKPYCEGSSLDWRDGSLELEVIENERVTHKDHFQDVRLIRVRGNESQPYSPGDYALVRARNRHEHVNKLLSLLHTHPADISFTLTANDVAFPVPPPMRRLVTLRHCATLYWDLTVHQGEVHILVAVVEYNTSTSQLRTGLCSHWLASRRVGDHIRIAVRTGSFRFPENSSVPLLMVGPGTGVAPFRGLAHERASAKVARRDRLLLTFGCRHRCMDFYLRSEWDVLSGGGHLTLLTAFSRDQPQKVYVQDVLRREADLTFDWLLRGGRVFVCGRADGMPAQVRHALVNVVQTAGNRTAESAERFIARLEAAGSYQTVVWS